MSVIHSTPKLDPKNQQRRAASLHSLSILISLLCTLVTSSAWAGASCVSTSSSRSGSLSMNDRVTLAGTSSKKSPANVREFPLRNVDSSASVTANLELTGGEARLFGTGPGGSEIGVRMRVSVDGQPSCDVYRKLARKEIPIPWLPLELVEPVSAGMTSLTCSPVFKPGSSVLRVEVFAESNIQLPPGGTEANTSLRGSLRSVAVNGCTGGWCTHGGAELSRADVDGDGFEDLLCRDPGRIWVDYADGSDRATGTTDWFLDTRWCTHTGAKLHTGDFDGDGRTDLFCHGPERLWIDYADELGQYGGTDWFRDTAFCRGATETLFVNDFDGDARADLLCRRSDRLRIDHADAFGRFSGVNWSLATPYCTHAGATFHVGDVNGDRRADLVCHDPGRVWIDYAGPGGVFAPQDWTLDVAWCGAMGATVSAADVSGDDRTDLVCRNGTTISTRRADAAGRLVVTN